MPELFDLKQIITPRLLLRPVQQGDQHALNAAIHANLEALQRWMPWANDPSLEATEAFINAAINQRQQRITGNFPLVIIHQRANVIIGATGFNEKSKPREGLYEIGYWVDSTYQGQGLVTESVIALSRFALCHLNATRVQLCIHTDNIKSINVANRCGYQLLQTLKNERIDNVTNKPADSYLYGCQSESTLPPLAMTVVWE